MPEYCTCGAALPPDARFCHKCGKPLQEEFARAQEPEPQPEPLPEFPPLPPLVLNFHNPVAVRTGLTMASLAALFSWLPFLNLGFVAWWVLAGYFSVSLYRRRTGQLLTVRNGLQMGWITGILTFAMMTVLFTLSLVPLALSKGGLPALFQQQLRTMSPNDPNLEQAVRIFQTPAGVATVLLFTLAVFFALITFLCTIGAALGAKLGGRGSGASYSA